MTYKWELLEDGQYRVTNSLVRVSYTVTRVRIEKSKSVWGEDYRREKYPVAWVKTRDSGALQMYPPRVDTRIVPRALKRNHMKFYKSLEEVKRSIEGGYTYW